MTVSFFVRSEDMPKDLAELRDGYALVMMNQLHKDRLIFTFGVDVDTTRTVTV